MGLQFCKAAEMCGGNEVANEGGMALDPDVVVVVDTLLGDVRLLRLFDAGGDREVVEWDEEERLVLELDLSSAAVMVCGGDGRDESGGAPLAIMVPDERSLEPLLMLKFKAASALIERVSNSVLNVISNNYA